ncbi:hypothetical protein HRS9139_04610 [Pyrenophora teres f. teres]|nr:hypothetical protein HRS9139_04610 [Pyrenophora teres f. teres]
MLMSQKSGRAKLDDVTRILSELKADLDAKQLSIEQRRKLLEQLKVYGRLIDNSDPIFTEDSDSIDDEFLAARVLFLMSYDANLDYAQLVRENQLADSINAAIARHAARYSKTSRQSSQEHTQPMELMALSETLKLVFNIIHFHKDLSPHFTPSIPNVFKMLVRRDPSSPPLATPTRELVNALLHLDLESTDGQKSVFPPFDPNVNITHLVTLLDKAIIAYPQKTSTIP